ncbi:hypothetical protein MPER_01806 [Moniliophthora perniciosa FA553]|nr:hypothetical protein MPER_01806 [Moniliophthora perniciosa FA553]
MVEQVAVSAAASHITDALVAVMLHHIKRNDPEAVLFLYEQCRGMMGDKGVWGDEPNDETSEDEVLPLGIDKPLSNVMPLVPGRVKILLAATTAYALLNSFIGALTMYTQSIPWIMTGLYRKRWIPTFAA